MTIAQSMSSPRTDRLSIFSVSRAYIASTLAFFVVTGVSFPTSAQSLPPEWEAHRLEPRSGLTYTEIQMLQDALIWVGQYGGLKDGGWGAGTDRALQGWRRSSNLSTDSLISRAELVALFEKALSVRTEMGWTLGRDSNTGFWFGWPAKIVRGPQPFRDDVSYGSDYEARGEGQLRLTTRVTRADARSLINDFAKGESGRRLGVTQVNYRLDRPDRQVVSLDTSNGTTIYIRYDRFGSEWRGLSVAGKGGIAPLWLIAPISAEFTGAPTPTVNATEPGQAPIIGSVLAFIMQKSSPSAEGQPSTRKSDPVNNSADSASKPDPRPPTSASRSPVEVGSGTAFVVRRDGMMLTNAHVVEGCGSLALADGTAISVVAVDEKRDLALVRAAHHFPTSLAFRRDQTIDHGERVLVFGYPYYRLVSESLNITDGIVTSLTGLRGSTRNFQISANMQPGNSGGPVLDGNGRVIGIAVAVLNSLAVARATGTLPQGMNYAIRGQVVDAFLLENGIMSEKKVDAGTRDLREIARDASDLVLPLICSK